jgi:hypothetical protein
MSDVVIKFWSDFDKKGDHRTQSNPLPSGTPFFSHNVRFVTWSRRNIFTALQDTSLKATPQARNPSVSYNPPSDGSLSFGAFLSSPAAVGGKAWANQTPQAFQ